MYSAQRKWMVVVLIGISLFGVGLAKLFWLRFESGDLYPPYSSLRGDPLGAQVLYESLNRIRPHNARRNYKPLHQITVAADDTLLMMGLPGRGSSLHNAAWEHVLDQIALNGGRLVISFRSSAGQRHSRQESPDTCDEEENLQGQNDKSAGGDSPPNSNTPPKEDQTTGDEECREQGCASFRGVWDTLGIEIKPSKAKTLTDVAERTLSSATALPAVIPYRSPFFFTPEDLAWQTLYQSEGEPVVVTRPWGAGSIVMTGDSYLFSNEALRKDRFSDLLTWFIQPPHRVMIDEFHNGLSMQAGIASLMHKYRLHGVLVSLAVLLVLLLWRQTSAFVTITVEPEQTAHIIEAGSDTAEGLIGLMQQHIRAEDLLKVCYAAWHNSAAAGRVAEDRLVRIKELVADSGIHPRRKDMVSVYRQICELLKQGRIR